MRVVSKFLTLSTLAALITACGGGSGNGGSGPVAPDPITPDPIAAPPTPEATTILAIGDSFFEFHVDSQQSIPDEVGKALQLSVDNRAEGGAMISGGDGITDIKDQYVAGNWDWVVMDGGGNDLNEKCACNACEQVMDDLISQDATSGEIPALANQIISDGSKVAYMMYPEIPEGAEGGFDQCGEEFAELLFRVNQLALNTENFWLVEASDVVPSGDLSYFVSDRVHPSVKGTQAIGQQIAQTIEENPTF